MAAMESNAERGYFYFDSGIITISILGSQSMSGVQMKKKNCWLFMISGGIDGQLSLENSLEGTSALKQNG